MPPQSKPSVLSPSLTRYAWLSIATAIATITLKTLAWRLTDSVGMLSDALESLVNLASALVALWALTLAMRPADDHHAHGHGKVEYFSSAFEGLLIFAAAIAIAFAAVDRWRFPQPLTQIGLGVAVCALASVLNLIVGLILYRVGKQYRSMTLEADAHHLLTDVWTSAGVIVGVSIAWYTQIGWLDPAIALLVAGQILWTGWNLLHRSWSGLMDASVPAADLVTIEQVLDGFRAQGIDFHALRTRQAGMRAFLTLHVLVPGAWSVQRGHDLCEMIEAQLRQALPHAHVMTHLEPLEDPVSHDDIYLDR